MKEASGDENLLEPGGNTAQESRYLFISDPHCNIKENCSREMSERVEEYGKEYGCDTLVIGGDVIGTGHLERFLQTDFEEKKLVRGNHDNYTFKRDISEMDSQGEINYSPNLLKWGENGYTLALRHDPSDFETHGRFDMGHEKKEKPKEAMDWVYDIILYGHTHRPHVRIFEEDNTLAIGAGSIYWNYTPHDCEPRKSAHILTLEEDGTTVQHLDYEKDRIMDEKKYVKEDGVLKPAS